MMRVVTFLHFAAAVLGIDMTLSGKDLARYMRHLDLPEIGMEGQQKLMNAAVLVIGAGGLGAPVLMYLAAAGVGRIGISDDDLVEESNLQRQPIYRTEDVGRHKIEKAADFIEALNPGVTVNMIGARVTAANIRELLPDYDLIVDATDNAVSRYQINDACFFDGKTLVSGGLRHWDGQLSTFKAFMGEPHPCYRCLHPEPGRSEIRGDCREGGMAGPVAGVMGAAMALEVVKELTGAGDSLSGRLWIFDGLNANHQLVKLLRDPDCPLCGRNPKISDTSAAGTEARLG